MKSVGMDAVRLPGRHKTKAANQKGAEAAYQAVEHLYDSPTKGLGLPGSRSSFSFRNTL